jgi:hypothetical protein
MDNGTRQDEQLLIEKLINAPTLAFPDFLKRFNVETDKCEYVM